MDTEKIFDILKKQGLPFLLLAGAVWYFYVENKHLNDRIDKLSFDNVQISVSYKVDHESMRLIIQNNTDVIKKNTEVFETILKKKYSE